MVYLLGVDIGTTKVRGSIVSPNGKVISSAAIEHNVHIPRQGWAEQDPLEDWWGDFLKTIKELLKGSDVNPSKIVAVGVSGSYPNLCPTTYDGKPLRNAILYSDNRCMEEVKYLRERFNIDLTPEEILPKLLWFKNHEPDKFNKTGMIFSSHNYITYKLTNKYSIDNLSAISLIGLLNGLCEKLGIPKEIIPPIHPSTEITGEVTKVASKYTGLKIGTPVIVGTADSFSNMLGIGAINKGDCMINYGTAGFSVILNQDLEKIATGKLAVFTLVTYILTIGELLKWFRDNFCKYEMEKFGERVYQILDENAKKIPPGSEGLIIVPYLRGKRIPVFNPNAKGIIWGLSIAHSKAHIYRAILESWGFAIRQGLDRFRKDVMVGRIIATGGGAKSNIWKQIVSDTINKPQEYVESDPTLANAFLAGYGIGIFKNFTQIKDWIKVSEITSPNPNNTMIYDQCYIKYNKIESSFFEEKGDMIE